MATTKWMAALIVVGTGLFLASLQAAEQSTIENGSAISVPRFITLNGVIKDQSGRALNGVVGVRFTIYKTQDTDIPLWSEIQNVQLDELGRYTILLGASTNEGMPVDLFTSGDARWLGVSALVPGQEEQARVLLVSVPYALKAADADTLGGKPLSAFVLAKPKDSSNADATNSAKSDTPMTFAVSGTGTANKLTKWVDANGTLGDSAVTESAGQVGIGTATPLAALDVNGADVNLLLRGSGTHSVAIQGSNSNGRLGQDDSGFFFASDTTGKALRMLTNNGALNEWLTVTSSGNIGMGTSTPLAKLHVDGLDASMILGGAGTHSLAVQGTASSGRLGQDSNGFFFASDTNGKALRFLTNNGALNEWMRVTSSGNVGVGTATPTQKFDVVGTVKSTSFVGDGAGVTNVNATALGGLSAAALTAAAKARGITYLAGCDTCSVLLDTDDQKTIYLNLIGAMTIESVTCFSDAGTPTINLQRDDGAPANVLSSNLACSTTGATTSTFVNGESVLNLSDKLDFVMSTVAGGAKRVTVAIKASLN